MTTTKSQRGFTLDADVIGAARNAVAAVRGKPGAPQTMSALVAAAVTRVVTELQDQHNDGRPFPYVARLPSGRPRRNKQPADDTRPGTTTVTTGDDVVPHTHANTTTSGEQP
jgi:hypothetical protein